MNITLESVQFRIPGAQNGAFNLSVPGQPKRSIVTGPEWLRGVRQPAAFAKQAAPPFIEAGLVCSETGTVHARLQARAVGGHVLGDIAPQEIIFESGRWKGRIELAAAQIAAVGKHEIEWHWRVTSGADEFVFDTSHEIYTVLGEPTEPWEADGNDASAAPWKEALEAGCDWAKGARASEEILTAIANHHYHSGRLKYGGRTYTEEGIFKLAAFLQDQSRRGVNEVDCTDCATIGVTFGKLLGATCQIVVVDTVPESDFIPLDTNVFIGGEQGPGTGFNQHETIWNMEDASQALVWDFCLGRKVNGQAEPYTARRFHNSPASDTTYPELAFIPVTAKHLRPVSFPTRYLKDTAPVLNLGAQFDAVHLGFEHWSNRFRDFKGLAYLNLAPGKVNQAHPVESFEYRNRPKPWLTEYFYRFEEESFRVSIFECESRLHAHVALLRLLDIQRARPKLTSDLKSTGDVLFYDADGKSDMLLFGRGNLAIRLQRNVGSKRPLRDDAQHIDRFLIQGLDQIQNGVVHEAELTDEAAPLAKALRYYSDAAELGIIDGVVKLRDAASGLFNLEVTGI